MDQPVVSDPAPQEIEREFRVNTRNGLHVRPASQLVETANRFAAEIVLVHEERGEVDAKSALSIMTLGAEQGTLLRVRCSGDDAAAAMEEITRLFETNFGEP